MQELRASGLLDADTFDLIETTMTNATAELARLHASGAMSDEIYAQAMASMPAATSASSPAVDAADLELLQRGETATATVRALPAPDDGTNARRRVTLEVHPTAGPSYEVECNLGVHPGGELEVGDFLRVKVDPQDPKRVAIDWNLFGA